MKKLLAIGIFAFTLLMTACSDKPVPAEQVPDPVKDFIQKKFPGQAISFAKKDIELTGSQYDVVLAGGTRIEFDTDNEWDKIEGTIDNPIHEDLVPAAIVTFVKLNHPDAQIIKIDKERYGFEVELTNGLELKFNNQFEIIDIDD